MSGTAAERVQLDVVVPLYDEIEVVAELHRRLLAALSSIACRWHIIYVDDGSTDGTGEWLATRAVDDLRVTHLRLSRNFGQPAAIAAGLSHSSGDCVALMDGDLQDPPEQLPELFAHWNEGIEVVIAARRSRAERGLRGLALRGFHKVFRFLSDAPITPNAGTFCLLDRQAVDAIVQLPESHRYFPGLRSWIGFRQSVVLFDRPERAGGAPKQTLRRLIRYAADAVFSFSLKPLRLLTFSGALLCLFAFALASWFVVKRLLGLETAWIGFTTLTCFVLGMGGFQLIAVGILGEYVGRIYEEVKRRPISVVRLQKRLSSRADLEDPRSGRAA